MASGIVCLADEVLQGIALFLDVRSICSLDLTARSLHETLSVSPKLWEALCIRDFRIAPQAFPRLTAVWSRLYRRMHAPVVLTWGQSNNGRLGHDGYRNIDRPRVLDTTPMGKIARITCSGFGMHSLTQKGDVWFWGSLDGHVTMPMTKIPLPEPCRSVSSGRTFGCALGDSGVAYAWSERRGVNVVRCNVLPDGSVTPVVAIVAGWTTVAMLHASGAITACDVRNFDRLHAMKTFVLPVPDKAIAVACGADFTAAITDCGHVYVWRGLQRQCSRLDDADGRPILTTHATACHQNLSVYDQASCTVRCFHIDLHQMRETTPAELTGKQVCKVTHGDWHSGVLTSDGAVWTWGNGSEALGTGYHAGRVAAPTLVTQGLEGLFVFDIGFGGWHSAALAVALDDTVLATA
ncbi:hypothetical protein ACHHYP_13333 [Achlya hypogyna]|uniref:Regulator of chromosome condensation (RCC1)-like protein n=1 Tax=Achlya hypogyna TaxID=1202772 RepID=A0A1V9YFF7_ACHHY|nr:hypothetical protein ACHHYP_13333 [Achlya hypogyna]